MSFSVLIAVNQPRNRNHHHPHHYHQRHLDIKSLVVFNEVKGPFPSDRALSDVQECAQLLSGPTMPQTILSSLLNGTSQVGQHIGIINLTPYEGDLERVCFKWPARDPAHTLTSLSLTADLTIMEYCQKVCAMDLFEVGCGVSKWASCVVWF